MNNCIIEEENIKGECAWRITLYIALCTRCSRSMWLSTSPLAHIIQVCCHSSPASRKILTYEFVLYVIGIVYFVFLSCNYFLSPPRYGHNTRLHGMQYYNNNDNDNNMI